jgi:YidC/Oxa1 family membrane protein insertase
MDKNNIIGLLLIFALLFLWTRFNAPSEAERIAQQQQDSIQRVTDSIANAKIAAAKTEVEIVKNQVVEPAKNDSSKIAENNDLFGVFAPSSFGNEKIDSIENEVFKIFFTSKGGRIKEVVLKNYGKTLLDSLQDEYIVPVRLLENEKNRFEYILPVIGTQRGTVNTGELFFKADKSSNSIVYRADAGDGRYFEQKYTFSPDTYNIGYEVKLVGLNNYVNPPSGVVKLKWVNWLDKIEKSVRYERPLTSIYFKPLDDDTDNCSCTGDDQEDADGRKIKWVSNVNQFFNSTLIADDYFKSADMEIEMPPEEAPELKKMVTNFAVPIGGDSGNSVSMNFYIGPNVYEQLLTYNLGLEEVIPYGRSVLGTVNRHFIRPIFEFISRFIGSKGVVILILTFLVKLVLYPLTYKMLHSQSKMAALKPQLAKMKEKHPDDQQKQQMESMKLYREFGVNPLGGCFPIALQMPIWFALYRFFPASIEFRQASFLWATDLSSYDVFWKLPFELPLGMGAHISMFTLLWALTTVIYTFYNSKHMDMSANPMMKYMQYLMPIMFLGFFNSYASGLTCYLFFSNIFNIGQTIITKNFIINQDKIKRELEAYKKKPKKKGGFSQRLETAMKDAQKQQAEKEGKKGKKGKK